MPSVVSRDGTEISWHTSGDGPPLVLLHGTGSNHTTWLRLLPHLEPRVSAHAVDRRGRGASGDAPGYDPARELEDVAAVLDAVAEAAGSPVDVLGHSFGAFLALLAAPMTPNLGRLVLYEPPLGSDAGTQTADRIEALVAAGDRDAALELFLREDVLMSDEDLAAVRALPGWWESRVAITHTIPRELRAVPGPFRLEQAARVEVPTLLLLGGDSPAAVQDETRALAAALPHATTVTLAGQEHVAHLQAPELVAGHVVSFLRSRRGAG